MAYNTNRIIGGVVKSPCTRDCTGRVVGCHSTCELYINYVKEKEEVKNKINTVRNIDSNYSDFKANNIRKTMRRHGK